MDCCVCSRLVWTRSGRSCLLHDNVCMSADLDMSAETASLWFAFRIYLLYLSQIQCESWLKKEKLLMYGVHKLGLGE